MYDRKPLDERYSRLSLPLTDNSPVAIVAVVVSPSGFEVVASLGRRRTSTVNEGTARLNVVLASSPFG
jgi:hypothetical protein